MRRGGATHQTQNIQRGARHPSANQGKGVNTLIHHLSRNTMYRNRTGEVVELCDVSCRRDIKAFRVVVQGRVCGGCRRWQAMIQARVKHLSELCENNFAMVREGEAGFLHCNRYGHRLRPKSTH